MCECHPLQTQHFFIFLFTSFKKWLILIFFVNLRYSYSMEHRLSQVLLVTCTGCFGFQVSARQENWAAQLLLNSNGAKNCALAAWPLAVMANLGRVNNLKQTNLIILTNSQCTKFKAFWFNWNTFSIKISLFEKLNQIILFKNIYQFIQQDYLVALGKLIYLVAFCFWNQIGRDRGRDLIKFDILSPIFKQMFHQKSKCK